MKNSKILIIFGVIVVILVAIIGYLISSYNGLVSINEEVETKYSNISVQLERRTDLIPNLVNTVKGYVKHEQDIINSVTKARENLINANGVKEKAEANQELTTALNNLLVVVENYPDLKANTNFINLQDELAGTENRISVARTQYNEAVKDYNKTVKSFPTIIMANMFDFDEKEYFEAKETSNEVPNVSFE